ncbi:tubulin-tyrosine ligase family-domain-containing protein [Phakopsora pachyrhizi]|uniref:Tubulin-tyrosine ligase family-domain-containing protein n=1 Tax=Phakopsora pachyrhizi TaxID=170000 RepID=A0AAV0BIE6_PHAPC|nr:tubulin-tyrosine ligase family-domain-containing protein [Phakopsora pachyrhizi]
MTNRTFEPNQITINYDRSPSDDYTTGSILRSLDRCIIPRFKQKIRVSIRSRPSIDQDLSEKDLSNDKVHQQQYNHHHNHHGEGAIEEEEEEQQQQQQQQVVGSVQISDYDLLDWDVLNDPQNQVLINSYPIRKALIRKNYLIETVKMYEAKRRDRKMEQSLTTGFLPRSWHFEISFPDELDELLQDELFEVSEALSKQQDDCSSDDRLFILKPALSDRADGIRLFDSIEQLYEIFGQIDEEEEENPTVDEPHTTISQMKHWIIQKYISNPLLIDPKLSHPFDLSALSNSSKSLRKHHLRVYVLAVGALKVYVFKDILSLFSSKPFNLKSKDLSIHITNTCLNNKLRSLTKTGVDLTPTTMDDTEDDAKDNGLVYLIDQPSSITDQIDRILRSTFLAATSQPINFQLNSNCFEVFGVDFLIDSDLKVWLLEFNSGPDFNQSGDKLRSSIDDLFVGVAKIVIEPFLCKTTGTNNNDEGDGDDGRVGLDDWGVSEERFKFRKIMELDLLAFNNFG